MRDIIQLRGHHLLCVLPYVGKGYTQEFINNFNSIVEQINHGAEIEITSGPDMICASLRRGFKTTCAHSNNCRKTSVRTRDHTALRDVARVLRIKVLKPGDRVRLKERDVRRLRHSFRHGAIRRACMSCEWHKVCSAIAADHYADTLLFPNA